MAPTVLPIRSAGDEIPLSRRVKMTLPITLLVPSEERKEASQRSEE